VFVQIAPQMDLADRSVRRKIPKLLVYLPSQREVQGDVARRRVLQRVLAAQSRRSLPREDLPWSEVHAMAHEVRDDLDRQVIVRARAEYPRLRASGVPALSVAACVV
jgi:hypothetical protein